MSQTLVVTVARNVRDVPLRLREWDALKDEILSEVHSRGFVYFEGEGRGDSERWGLEDAYTVVGEWGGTRTGLGTHDALSKIGRYYGQEAVAVTVGDTSFV